MTFDECGRGRVEAVGDSAVLFDRGVRGRVPRKGVSVIELWAFMTRQKVVYLKDFDGEVTKTVAKKTPFGYVAKRHWPFNVRNVLLLEDGTVGNGGYVESWKAPNAE